MRRSLLTSILAAFGFGASGVSANGGTNAPAPSRRSCEQSVARLRDLGLVGEEDVVVPPDRLPRYDDEEPLGVSFFRTELRDVDLSGLTLPRSFFGRSEVARVSFRNTDLSESNLCWNDFRAVDFSDASLAGADLRASLFEDCRFVGATMTGAIITRGQIDAALFTAAQRQAIDWRRETDPEPDGG